MARHSRRSVAAALVPIYGITLIDVVGTMIALLSRVSPPDERGAIMGLNDAASNVALMIAPLAGGLAFDLNPRLVGIAPGLAAAIALCVGAAARWRGRAP